MKVEFWNSTIEEPKLTFTLEADTKIRAMLKHHKNEVMFYLLIRENNPHVYEVYDILYPKNTTMSGAFCQVDEQAHSNSYYGFTQRHGTQRATEIFQAHTNGIAHSHVDMGATFSGYDITFMKEWFTNYSIKWFVFAVFNKRMENTIHLYEAEFNAKFTIDYIVQPSEAENASHLRRIAKTAASIPLTESDTETVKHSQVLNNAILSRLSKRRFKSIDTAISYLAERRSKDLVNLNRQTLPATQQGGLYDDAMFNGNGYICDNRHDFNYKDENCIEVDISLSEIMSSIELELNMDAPLLYNIWIEYGVNAHSTLPNIMNNLSEGNLAAMLTYQIIELNFQEFGPAIFDTDNLYTIMCNVDGVSIDIRKLNSTTGANLDMVRAAKDLPSMFYSEEHYGIILSEMIEASCFGELAIAIDAKDPDDLIGDIDSIKDIYSHGMLIWSFAKAIFAGSNINTFNKQLQDVLHNSEIAEKNNVLEAAMCAVLESKDCGYGAFNSMIYSIMKDTAFEDNQVPF